MATTVLVNLDFLLLQEIRDKRTAAAAISMALQGKQVHSTLHGDHLRLRAIATS